MKLSNEAHAAVVAGLLDALREWLPRDADHEDLASVLGAFVLTACCYAAHDARASRDRWQLAEQLVRLVGHAVANVPTEALVAVMLDVEAARGDACG